VHFVNKTQRGQLKVCKALGPGSSDLIGQTFYLGVGRVDSSSDLLQLVPITAAAQTQCVIVGNFPIGSTVDVEEICGVVPVELLDGNGECNQFIDVSGEGEITIAPGINTKTITNTAKGLLEICKAKVRFVGDIKAAVPVTQPYFYFRVDGGSNIKIRAGTCSLPMRVSVGTHTVSETSHPDYELDPYAPGNGITVNPADREISRNLNTRTVTVNVPYGPNGETLVTFYNRVKLGQVKVCKQIPLTSQDTLGGKYFQYLVQFQDGGSELLGPILPGECTYLSHPHPVLLAPGVYQGVQITEQPANGNTASYTVTNVTCTGCRLFGWAGGPVSGLILGPGVNAVTYTNTAVDP
jgi:hypothetical protein